MIGSIDSSSETSQWVRNIRPKDRVEKTVLAVSDSFLYKLILNYNRTYSTRERYMKVRSVSSIIIMYGTDWYKEINKLTW